MNKREFIEGLRRSLSSINDYAFVNDTISYYENYIDTQIRIGKTEEEVMAQLGDPRLIAKSIRATKTSEDGTEQDGYKEYEQNSYDKQNRVLDTLLNFNGRLVRMPSWLAKIVGILVLIFVFWLVFTVLRWLAPFIVVGCCAYLVYKFFIGKY